MSQKERTVFGVLLEEYRARAGFTQEEFSRRMREAGYTAFSQRLASYMVYKKSIRVYSDFFPIAAEVLRLDRFEQAQLVDAWLSLPGSVAKDDKSDEG